MSEHKTTIPFPCYGYRIYVIFSDNIIETANGLVKKNVMKSAHWVDDTTDGFTVKSEKRNHTFVVLKKNTPLNNIVHETYHGVSNMFSWIGAEHEPEIFAYSLAYMVDIILSEQKKLSKPLDKQPE